MKTNQTISFVLLIILLLSSCRSKPDKTNNAQSKVQVETSNTSTKDYTDEKSLEDPLLNIVYSEDKESIKAYYDIPYIKEFYGWHDMTYTILPPLNYPEDLSTLSYDELRILRNEVFARNGYLFNDAFLRGYFNRFKWYMPVFFVDTFKVVLNKEERDLVNRIIKEEANWKKNITVSREGLMLYNADLIVNNHQFTEIPENVSKDFHNQNFSIINANRAMPFYTYDENAYQYIPHYITTDLYLFILHKYFSKFIEKLDENYLYHQLRGILENAAGKINSLSNANNSSDIQSSIEWAQMYCALSLYAIGDSLASSPAEYASTFQQEKNRIDNFSGSPVFIENRFVDYGELKPRGHYTKSKVLEKYFKGFKWISLNGIDLDNAEQLKGLIVFAHVINNDEKLLNQYQQYVSVIEKLAGQEDNLSLSDMIGSSGNKSLKEELSDENLAALRNQMKSFNKERITKVFGESFHTIEESIKRVYFLSSTYSISAEIFSRLVHIDGVNSKRPFPRGLDIPSVFGNITAQEIILSEYRDNENWPEYLPRLKELQEQFKDFNNWNHCYGLKGLQTALSACREAENFPDYMKTDAYNRKELSTALSSWTHIKHDLILYQEKPWAVETGQGGGMEPPQHYSYVEPNLLFWDASLELIEWLENLSIHESTFDDELRRIKELGNRLRTVAYKEIEGTEITKEEYDRLHYIGGTIEYILLGLLETDHLPEREKSMALIADVYVYNGVNLNVAVGHADEIYVVAPIEGEYYIARGSIFSYFEFEGKIYNDEEWREQVKRNDIPDRPEWIKPLVNDFTPIKGQMQFRY